MDHGERKHALLSASGAERWLNCPPSARMEESHGEGSSATFYTAEGELAHEIAELKARKHFTQPMSKSEFTKQLNRLKKTEFDGQAIYDKEMLKHTETYMDYLKDVTNALNSTPHVTVEKQVDYSNYAPEGFGTADCIIVGSDQMYVIDFKYGKGIPVSAEENKQMKLYALGALNSYGFLYNIKHINMVIVQPRLDSISEYSLSKADLVNWGDSIKETAQLAYKGGGEFNPGEHCRFCKINAQCRARKKSYDELDGYEQAEPVLLSNDEIGDALKKAQGLQKWIDSMKKYALKQMEQGETVKGWKPVRGKGSRQFTDQDAAFSHLQENNVSSEMLYNREPLTVAQLEKQLGKKRFRELIESPGFVEKLQGNPTIADEKDNREAITFNTPEDDFK